MKLGQTVIYVMRQYDADEVNRRRDEFQEQQAARSHGVHPHAHGELTEAPGYVAHIGSTVSEGDECAAHVTKVWPSGTLNLRAIQDGTDVQWVRNVPEGNGPGTWRAAE